MLDIEIKAPDFTLPDQNYKNHSLSDYLEGWVLLYFYPKDNTPGCTQEACAIRDAWEEYESRGVIVIGISNDSVESHKKFQEDHDLPFILLADEDAVVTELYEANGKLYTKRISYLINPEGEIAATFEDVDPAIHAVEVLKKIDSIK